MERRLEDADLMRLEVEGEELGDACRGENICALR